MWVYGFCAAHSVWVFAVSRSRWKKPSEDKWALEWFCGENLPAAVRIVVITTELLLTFQAEPKACKRRGLALKFASGWLRPADHNKSGQLNKGQERNSDKVGGKRKRTGKNASLLNEPTWRARVMGGE